MDLTRMREKLTGTLRDSKTRTNLIVILAAAAALLIVFPDFSCASENVQQENTGTAEEYAQQLEIRLEEIISEVEGAGETRVMVTLQSGKEYIYASEDSTSTDSSASTDSTGRQSSDESENRQSSFIIIDTEQGEQALICTELMPSVSGVVVVCQGAGDPTVAERIMAVVTTALDISSKRVCITQLSQ